jgi:hypothetical protein
VNQPDKRRLRELVTESVRVLLSTVQNGIQKLPEASKINLAVFRPLHLRKLGHVAQFSRIFLCQLNRHRSLVGWKLSEPEGFEPSIVKSPLSPANSLSASMPPAIAVQSAPLRR